MRVRPSLVAPYLVAAVLLIASGCGGTSTEDAAQEHGAARSVTLWTDSMEVFFEHPPLLAGTQSEPWAVHITRLSDYQPVEDAGLTLAFRAPDGRVFTTTASSPSRPGIYLPAPQLPAAGTYDLVIDVAGPALRERVNGGAVTVYASADEVPATEAPPAGDITYLKEQQWSSDFAVERAAPRSIPYAIDVSGEIVPAAGRVAEVSAPVTGTAAAQANLSAPAVGERVGAGQTLAVLAPTAESNTYAQARARVERLRREVERLERLYEAEAVAEVRLIEARHDLDVAATALEAIGGESGDEYTYTVRSPLSGVVQRRSFTPGQHVDAGEPLFEIVDASTVWLRLDVPARHAEAAGAAENALFTPEGSDVQYQSDGLVSVGTVVDSDSRTLPVVLAVNNPQARLKIGQFVRAQLRVGGTRTGVSVPASAIMNEDGESVVYVQLGGESFERRPVVLGATDGRHTLIASGLTEGEHVVTEGAYQVYLASLGTSEIGDHGHPH